MPTNYKLCAIDLDDTLLGPDHQLSERSARTIRQCIDQGVIILVASGRMFAAALPTAQQLDLDTPIICYNGAMVKHPKSGHIWMEESVQPRLARQVMEFAYDHKLQLNFYWQDMLYTAAYTDWLKLYHERTSAPIQLEPDFYQRFRDTAPTKLIIVDAPDVIDGLLQPLRDRFGEELYVTRSNAEYLEFLPPGANKGTALEFVANRFGVTAEQTIAFGDSWNDLPMIQWAGLGIAVGNAKPDVKAAAQRTIGTNAEDGVAIALEEIFSLR